MTSQRSHSDIDIHPRADSNIISIFNLASMSQKLTHSSQGPKEIHLKNQLDHFSPNSHISSLEVRQLPMVIFCLPASSVIKALLFPLVT